MRSILSSFLAALAVSACTNQPTLAQTDQAPLAQLHAELVPFHLDSPTDSLAQTTRFIRRNRGPASYLRTLLQSSGETRKRILAHYVQLKANSHDLASTAKKLDLDEGEAYRTQLKFDVLRLLVEIVSRGEETFRFSSNEFYEAYYSRPEGRAQRFQVLLPPPNTASTSPKLPLFVQVFGADVRPTASRPFVRIRCGGRGVWGYRSIGRYDIVAAIEQAKLAFNIDANRVYMTGTSAGATGAMHAAALRQDLFAGLVPLVAFGNDLPLDNFANLPLRCEHGQNDWTSSIGNVRVQFQRLSKLGYDAKLHEHPTAGHGIRRPPPETMTWLFQQQRPQSPERVVHTCETPADGRAYWFRIDTFHDPHRRAYVDARKIDRQLQIDIKNVLRFSVDWSRAPSVAQFRVNSQPPAAIEDKSSWTTYEQQPNGKWRAQTLVVEARRPYTAGAAANLFQGEPLLVVYGTGGDRAENAFLRRCAETLSRCGGPHFKSAAVRFPVRADREMENLDTAGYNLLIIGGSEVNSYLAKFSSELPYEVENQFLKTPQREPLDLRERVLSFHSFNPLQPKQALYIVAPYLSANSRPLVLANPRKFLAGSDGFKRIDQPDLMVRAANLQLCREMQLNRDWRLKSPPGAAAVIPARFANRDHLAFAHMKSAQERAEADFAFWWGPEDKGAFGGYDFNWLPTLAPNAYTKADYLVRRREVETLTANLTGEELLDIQRRWIDNGELMVWPSLDSKNVDPTSVFRVVLPMDLVVKLGNRRKTLSDVRPGPMLTPKEVAEHIFSSN